MKTCVTPEKILPLAIAGESKISAELDLAIRRLLCACFPADTGIFSRTRHWRGSAPAFSLIALRAGAALGHVGVVRRKILFGSELIPIAGIQNLAVRCDFRGSGLSQQLMIEAMLKAREDGAAHGILFCVPGLERFYASLGWAVSLENILMFDCNGTSVSMPEKNICMTLPLRDTPVPPGTIHLQGADW
jgi:predicted N-acetyltransferase YhbS